MTTRIQEECESHKVNYTSVHSAALKKFATGKGNADKTKMVHEAQRRFGDHIIDHNEAEALLLLEYVKTEIYGG
jgi:Holliday junction resolvasome RuvABC endonuclease subunit